MWMCGSCAVKDVSLDSWDWWIAGTEMVRLLCGGPMVEFR